VAAGEVTTDLDPDGLADSKSASWQAQQADAFVAVARSYLDDGHVGEGGRSADHYQVVVQADAKAVKGGPGCADLTIDGVKRRLCDCSVVLVAEDAGGTPLDITRKQRTVSTPLKRALYARDGGCTFPGCHRTRYLDAHHLEHWVDGGETTLGNMKLLCRYHHRMLHEGGFSAVSEADGSWRFVTADGRTIPRGGYRLEDFVDDTVVAGSVFAVENPPRGGCCTNAAPRGSERMEVREPPAVYGLRRLRQSELSTTPS
jgi:hypothetical protein